jgi:carbon starvation protein
MNLAVIIIGALAFFALAYRVVGRLLNRHLEVDPTRPTPATTVNDKVDYVPTNPFVLFGHHFSSIAGAGPIVGPIIAGLYFGWGSALLWIVIGAALVGGVHDFTALIASIRHGGASIAQVCKKYLSPAAYYLMLIFVWVAMLYVIIVFLDLTATSFAPAAAEFKEQGGTVALASVFYMIIAVIFGVAVYRFNCSLKLASFIFVPMVFGALWLGHWLPWTSDSLPALFGSPKNTWSLLLLIYCFAASVLPVWVLLQPRDYLSSFLLIGCLVGGAGGIVVSGLTGGLTVEYPVFVGFNDANLGYLYPALFITIACGAMSGFHSIVSSGTTSKQLASEKDACPVAYGGMLTEGVLAVVALASVMILSKRPAAPNPVAVFGDGIGSFLAVFGVDPKFGATFGVLAVSTFLLTTLDTCTRLARFIFQELTGWSGSAGRYGATIVTLIVPSVMVFVEIPGPNGQPMPAWKAIWPAFGATNQLLGALALLVVYVWLKQQGKKALFVFVPMVFMCVTTLVALGQLTYLHLALPGGSLFVGWVSLFLAVVAVALIGNTFWRLTRQEEQSPISAA